MATVSEVLRGVARDFVVLAGAAGLGREVRRILLVRPPSGLTASFGRDDLVVYAVGGSHADGDAAERAVTALLGAGVAGVLCAGAPSLTAAQAADKRGSPLVTSSSGFEPEHLYDLLLRALEQCQAELGVLQADLQLDFGRLSSAGGTPAMLLERLVEATGKTGVLQATGGEIEALRQPALQDLTSGVVRRAIHTTDAAARRWMLETADATVANLLYLELPADLLVRLVAPVWLDGQVGAAVSLLAQSDELSGRDRVALVAAARAMSAVCPEVPQIAAMVRRPPYGAVVVRAYDVSVQRLAEVAHQRLAPYRAEVTVAPSDVRACLPYESQVGWRQQVAAWHAQLSADLGTVSLGHVVRSGSEPSDVEYALVQAAEAVLLGDHLFGPGHVTNYADAQLARFLVENRQEHELRALYERAVGKLAAEDLKRDSDLVTTLDAYCETVATQGTAARLGIHRNTVLYRLKLIEEITGIDLDDGSSRLLLQLGLLAGRLVRGSGGSRLEVGAALTDAHFAKVGRQAKAAQARTG